MIEDLETMEQGPQESLSKIVPTVIQETNHPIKKHDIDKEALKVLYRLRDAGFAGYLVGGGVRDLYLGKKPKDFDISTDARPGQLRKLFRNSRTIGRRFRLVQVFFRGGKIIEVSTLRSQSEYDINGQEQVLPSNNTFGTLEDDAFRRDLTINSLFYEIESNTIIDYVGGVIDLNNGLIRICGVPDRRVTRDPVRILRALRHAARTDFAIEEATWRALVENRAKLTLCPPSRIRDELLKDLRSGSSLAWAQLALKSRVFFTLFPCYESIVDGDHGPQLRHDLLLMFATLDRLHGEEEGSDQLTMQDYMIFALILTPWACERFQLLEQNVSGPAHHTLSRTIREELDKEFGERFNLKNAILEAMTILFVNLPTFQQFSGKKSWPGWLQKKSYFSSCAKFFALLSEARGGSLTDRSLFIEPPVAEQQVIVRSDVPPSGDGGSRPRRGGIMPAFSSGKGGIFGLRRE